MPPRTREGRRKQARSGDKASLCYTIRHVAKIKDKIDKECQSRRSHQAGARAKDQEAQCG